MKPAEAEPAEPPPLSLRLYVAGNSPNSTMALSNLKKLQASALNDRLELEIIDVLKSPDRALEDGVLVTPMLVKFSPLPECRILGNLSNTEAVLRALGFWED